MMNSGYVCLPRDIEDTGIMKKGNALCLFVHIVFRARYREGNFLGESIPVGSYSTHIATLSNELGMSFQSVRTALKTLKNCNLINIDTNSKRTLISVVNWEKFNNACFESTCNQHTEQHLSNNKRIKNNNNNYYNKIVTNNNSNYISNTSNNKSYYNNCAIDTLFDEFWKAYPRHVNKKGAISSFKKFTEKEIREQIIPDVLKRVHSEDWLKDDGKFIPHPTTYLNQRRWEDEIVERKSFYEELD